MMYRERYKSHHDASRNLKDRYTSPLSPAEYLPGILQNPAPGKRVVYLHVPFCNKVCSFCPFHRPDELDRRRYHEYLIAEIRKIREYPYMRGPVDAVNFGGGTPTSLSPAQMEAVLGELHDSFVLAPGAEVSVETSATELTDRMLAVLTAGGVNRLSVGVQTFDDDARRLLGRRGDGAFAAGRVAAALAAGIGNTSVDLLYNYPGQTEAQLQRDLDILSALDVAGVSLYSLLLHEKTPLCRRLGEAEKARMQDLARERRFFDRILDGLGGKGYRMLELSKLVKDGRDRYAYMEIRHSGGSCIAIGHGAGGNVEDYFYHNSFRVPDVSPEVRLCARGRVLRPEYRVLDALVYALQKGQADLAPYAATLGVDLPALLGERLQALEEAGLVRLSGSTVAFTRDGLFFGNNIISDCINRIAAR